MLSCHFGFCFSILLITKASFPTQTQTSAVRIVTKEKPPTSYHKNLRAQARCVRGRGSRQRPNHRGSHEGIGPQRLPCPRPAGLLWVFANKNTALSTPKLLCHWGHPPSPESLSPCRSETLSPSNTHLPFLSLPQPPATTLLLPVSVSDRRPSQE